MCLYIWNPARILVKSSESMLFNCYFGSFKGIIVEDSNPVKSDLIKSNHQIKSKSLYSHV